MALILLVLAVARVGNAGSDDEEASTSGSGSALLAPKEAKAKRKWLDDHLAAALAAHPSLSGAKISACVVDLASGDELFAHDADAGMNLASNAKLLTTVAALGTLGGGFRWRTAVYATELDDATGVVKGDLYVRGRGDPTLTIADLRALAADVAARGVRSVEGQLVIDASYFDTVTEPPHFNEQPNERAGFRAPIASFGVGKSAFDVIVIAEPGGTTKVRIEPDVGELIKVVKNDATSKPEAHTHIKVDAKPKQDHLEIEVSGVIAPRDGSFESRKRVDDPIKLAGEVMHRALVAQGIKFAKKGVGVGALPPNPKELAAHDSAPLALVIREMNKLSDNYVAESLLKTLGAETRKQPGPATWADGTAAVAAYLGTIGIKAGAYRADNGSGLFGATAVSAHQMLAILRAAHADYRIGPDLVASLPTGGADGTLAKRWHGHAAFGRVRAKTGTLDHVSTLAGYVAVTAAHPLAFAILVNDIPAGQRGPSRAMADDMVDAMAAYLDAK